MAFQTNKRYREELTPSASYANDQQTDLQRKQMGGNAQANQQVQAGGGGRFGNWGVGRQATPQAQAQPQAQQPIAMNKYAWQKSFNEVMPDSISDINSTNDLKGTYVGDYASIAGGLPGYLWNNDIGSIGELEDKMIGSGPKAPEFTGQTPTPYKSDYQALDSYNPTDVVAGNLAAANPYGDATQKTLDYLNSQSGMSSAEYQNALANINRSMNQAQTEGGRQSMAALAARGLTSGTSQGLGLQQVSSDIQQQGLSEISNLNQRAMQMAAQQNQAKAAMAMQLQQMGFSQAEAQERANRAVDAMNIQQNQFGYAQDVGQNQFGAQLGLQEAGLNAQQQAQFDQLKFQYQQMGYNGAMAEQAARAQMWGSGIGMLGNLAAAGIMSSGYTGGGSTGGGGSAGGTYGTGYKF